MYHWRIRGIVQGQHAGRWWEWPINTTVMAISADEAAASILRFYGPDTRWYNPPVVWEYWTPVVRFPR